MDQSSAGPEQYGRRVDAEHDGGLLDDVSGVHAEMSEIRERYQRGEVCPEARRRYLACWRALALRRSPGRRLRLSREFDDLLAERSRLLYEMTWREVEAIFESRPAGETPSPEAGSSLPR